MISKSKSFSESHNDSIIIVTPKEIDPSMLGEKYLGVEQVYHYTPESNDGMRRAHTDNYETKVYGNLEYLGEKEDLHFYDFYYFYDGEKITTLDGEINLPYYLIIKYNIRNCILMDKNTKVELKDTDYSVTVHANYSINKDEYKQVSRKYSYGIMKNEKSKDKIINLNEFKTNIVESLKPKNLKELIRRQCNYVEEKYLDANISLSSIPTDKEICDYISDCFIVDRDIFEDMSESLERGTYSLEDLVEDIKNDNLTYASNIPKDILIKILETYPDMIKVLDKETLPKDIVSKYAKGNVNWLEIPIEELNETDLVHVLVDMSNSDKNDLFDYYDYIVESLNKVNNDTKNKCMNILNDVSSYSRNTKISIYKEVGEIEKLIYLLERANDVSIDNLRNLPIDKFSTELLLGTLSNIYTKKQDGDTFYLIITELLKRMSNKELDSYISDSLIVGKIFLDIGTKIETHHVGWVIQSIVYEESLEILNLFTERNIKSFADSLFDVILEKLSEDTDDTLLKFLADFDYNYILIDYLSSDNKKTIREYLLNNINKKKSILENLGYQVTHLVKVLDFTKDDYVNYYLNSISSNCNSYNNRVIPKELLEELNNKLVLPCPNYDWVFDKYSIELYVGDKVKSREQLKNLLKSDSKLFKKALASAKGEKDGKIIPIDNISKWLFGVPNQKGFLFYRKDYNRVYLPENTPNEIIDLIKGV